MHITQVMGGVHLHMRKCARADVPHLPYLGNGLTDCAETWYVVCDASARLFTEAKDVLNNFGDLGSPLLLRLRRNLRWFVCVGVSDVGRQLAAPHVPNCFLHL